MNWKQVLEYTLHGSPAPDRRVEKSEEEWKGILSPEDYYILRQKGTERAFTGEFCEAHAPGKYSCKACDSILFDSTIKYDSRSGWPSFTSPYQDNAITYIKDTSMGMVRVEVQCAVCDSHLGHVFPDGPEPSGLRYCINSASLKLL